MGDQLPKCRDPNKCSNVWRGPQLVLPWVLWLPAWCGGNSEPVTLVSSPNPRSCGVFLHAFSLPVGEWCICLCVCLMQRFKVLIRARPELKTWSRNGSRKRLRLPLTADLSALGLSSLLWGCRVLGTRAGEGGHRLLASPGGSSWAHRIMFGAEGSAFHMTMVGGGRFSIWRSWIKWPWMEFIGILGLRGCAEGRGPQAQTHSSPGNLFLPLAGNTGDPVVLRGQRERTIADGGVQGSFESVAGRSQPMKTFKRGASFSFGNGFRFSESRESASGLDFGWIAIQNCNYI